jgi:hypothetical protein
MPTVSTSAIINQPVGTVFNYVVTVENHTAWQAGIEAARTSPPGPVTVGTAYIYTSKVMGRSIESQMQVTAFDPNRTWAVKTVGIPNPVETVYDFAAAGAGTGLTISMNVPSGAYPPAAEGMILQQMKKSLDEQAARIRQAVGG